MTGYFAFPPLPSRVVQPSTVESIGTCAPWGDQSCRNTRQDGQDEGGGNVEQASLERQRHIRREQERALSERSEIEWVRAGGVLRDAFGRRDKARTEQIRQELHVQDVERQRIARWEAYEARWRALQSSPSLPTAAAVLFVAFPWPLKEQVLCRDLSLLTRAAVSDFLFESLSVRTNATTKKERIRDSLLRWHPDKCSPVLSQVARDDLELVREGVHVVFGILKALQDAERTRTLQGNYP